MFDIQKVFTSEFFFQIDRVRMHRSDWALFLIAALLILAGIGALWYKRMQVVPYAKNLLARLARLFFTIGVLLGFWFVCRFEAVRWFGTRFAAVLVIVYGIVWLWFVFWDYRKNYKPNKSGWEKEQIGRAHV